MKRLYWILCTLLIVFIVMPILFGCEEGAVETHSYIRPADLSVETQQVVDMLGGHADWVFDYNFNEEKHLSLVLDYYENGEYQEQIEALELPKVMENGRLIFNIEDGEALLGKTDHKAKDEVRVELPYYSEEGMRQYRAILDEIASLDGELSLAALSINEDKGTENYALKDDQERQKMIEKNDYVYIFKVVVQ